MSWETVRDAFAIDRSRIHMAALLLSSHPLPVRRRIAELREQLEADPCTTWHEHWLVRETEAYDALARFIGARPEDIALTGSTTEGLAVVYGGLLLQPGDEILSTTHDHNSTVRAVDVQALRSGAAVRRISLYEHGRDATEGEMVRRFEAALRPETRVVAATWVHSCSGVKAPIAAMGAAVRRANAGRSEAERILFCVDAAHAFGLENFQIASLACDFFIAPGHKWLCGPRGTGFVWGTAAAWRRTLPLVPSFSAFFIQTAGRHASPGGFHAFENRWALPEALAFQEQIGRERIQQRIHDLATRLKERLAGRRGLVLHTPQDSALSSGIVCFEIDGMPPEAVVQALATRKIVSGTTPYEPSYARLTPSLLTDERDVEVSADAVLALLR